MFVLPYTPLLAHKYAHVSISYLCSTEKEWGKMLALYIVIFLLMSMPWPKSAISVISILGETANFCYRKGKIRIGSLQPLSNKHPKVQEEHKSVQLHLPNNILWCQRSYSVLLRENHWKDDPLDLDHGLSSCTILKKNFIRWSPEFRTLVMICKALQK